MGRLIPANLVVLIALSPLFAPAATAPSTTTAPATTTATATLKENDFLAICGDSITEQKLYSLYIEDYLLMCKPTQNLRAMQFGWGGEVAPGFLGRMSNVLRFPVTAATTCYGMNDGGYAALTPERATAYREGMTKIVDTFQKSGVRVIVVGSPGAVDTKFFKFGETTPAIYNKTLSELRDIARQVAAEQKVSFADVHGVMIDVMAKAKAKYGEDYPVGGKDGVHPLANGHVVMAYAFLKALGVDGNIGTITVDLAANKVEASDGHKVLSSNAGVVEIESSRYPFCFSGDPKDPSATAGVIEFLPFNQDLNRYLLIVKNPGGGGVAEKLKVTWGATSKEYDAAALAKGVNLAADFLNNPFSEPFKKVEEAVRNQQNYETPLIKELLHRWPEFLKMVPDQKPAFDQIATAAIEKAKTVNDAAVAAVTPVKHTIKIEKVTPPATAPAAAPATKPATAPIAK